MSTKKKVVQPKKTSLIEYNLWIENNYLYFKLNYISDKFFKWIEQINLNGDSECSLYESDFEFGTSFNPEITRGYINITNNRYTQHNIVSLDEDLIGTCAQIHDVIAQSVDNYKLSLVKKEPIVNNKDLPVNKDKNKIFKV